MPTDTLRMVDRGLWAHPDQEAADAARAGTERRIAERRAQLTAMGVLPIRRVAPGTVPPEPVFYPDEHTGDLGEAIVMGLAIVGMGALLWWRAPGDAFGAFLALLTMVAGGALIVACLPTWVPSRVRWLRRLTGRRR